MPRRMSRTLVVMPLCSRCDDRPAMSHTSMCRACWQAWWREVTRRTREAAP